MNNFLNLNPGLRGRYLRPRPLTLLAHTQTRRVGEETKHSGSALKYYHSPARKRTFSETESTCCTCCTCLLRAAPRVGGLHHAPSSAARTKPAPLAADRRLDLDG